MAERLVSRASYRIPKSYLQRSRRSLKLSKVCRRKLPTRCPDSTDIRRFGPHFGRSGPTSAKIRPTVKLDTSLGPHFGRVGQTMARKWQHFAEFWSEFLRLALDRILIQIDLVAKSGQHWPKSAELWPTLANFSRTWANSRFPGQLSDSCWTTGSLFRMRIEQLFGNFRITFLSTKTGLYIDAAIIRRHGISGGSSFGPASDIPQMRHRMESPSSYPPTYPSRHSRCVCWWW